MKYAIIFGAVAVLALGAWFLHNAPMTTPLSDSFLPTKQVSVGATSIVAEVADSEASREQGLSGRASLAEGRGMLFVFDTVGNYGFWMKDMQFSLDIIFADSSGRVLTVDSNLTPESYHKVPPQVFYPAKPAMYVLEVPAGFAAAHDIAVGAHLVVE